MREPSLAYHADHLHIGYRPAGGNGRGGLTSGLKRSDWFKLIDQLRKIEYPAVGRRPSKYTIPARRGD